jgi:hypothetical protein
MEKPAEGKVLSFHRLMDSGYDADTAAQYILSRGRVPITEPNKRRIGPGSAESCETGTVYDTEYGGTGELALKKQAAAQSCLRERV